MCCPSNKVLSSSDSLLGMHIPFIPPSHPFSPQASQSHFRLISPSDWFVPLVPSFKVLTFIHSWLLNDNEEGNHLYLLLVHGRATQRQKDRGRERENRREMAPVAWLSTKLRGGPGGGLRQLLLQKCHSWEQGSDPERLWDFSFSLLTYRK